MLKTMHSKRASSPSEPLSVRQSRRRKHLLGGERRRVSIATAGKWLCRGAPAAPHPSLLLATLLICCFVQEECKSADSEAAVAAAASAISTAKGGRVRQKKAQQTERRGKET